MTTCRGCGALFTEGHDEKRCELVAQILVERRQSAEKETNYINEMEKLTAERDALVSEVERLRRLATAAAEGMIATAKDGIELSKRFEELEEQRDALETMVVQILTAFNEGTNDDLILALAEASDEYAGVSSLDSSAGTVP